MKSVPIIDIKARRVLDSRGNPTLEVDVHTEHSLGSAMVPSGASTGIYEAVELRDKTKHYNGLDVSKAVRHVNTKIRSSLLGYDVRKQSFIDGELLALDGTTNKSRLGANALLGVSLAVARAAAHHNKQALFEYIAALTNSKPLLPVPFANVLNGGKHAPGSLEFQEFMIAPVKATSFSHATRIISEVYHHLKLIIAKQYGSQATFLGDEGGFAPQLQSAEEALELIMQALRKAGHTKTVKLAIDAAASEFYHDHNYTKDKLSPSQLKAQYVKLIKKYPLISLEDPYDQDDTQAFADLTKSLNIQVVGDDLTVSQPKRIRQAIEGKYCNSLLLKVNQVGTLTEALRAANIASQAGWTVMVSHRSGETEDSFIADLAVGLGCGMIKLGAPARGERTAKYNQLLRIEEYLGRKSLYGLRR